MNGVTTVYFNNFVFSSYHESTSIQTIFDSPSSTPKSTSTDVSMKSLNGIIATDRNETNQLIPNSFTALTYNNDETYHGVHGFRQNLCVQKFSLQDFAKYDHRDSYYNCSSIGENSIHALGSAGTSTIKKKQHHRHHSLVNNKIPIAIKLHLPFIDNFLKSSKFSFAPIKT